MNTQIYANYDSHTLYDEAKFSNHTPKHESSGALNRQKESTEENQQVINGPLDALLPSAVC